MDKKYVIQWKSRTNGRTGTGTTLFDREEAEHLAQELNRDFPGIEHQSLDTQAITPPASLSQLPVEHPA
jgi:hypothetical protein